MQLTAAHPFLADVKFSSRNGKGRLAMATVANALTSTSTRDSCPLQSLEGACTCRYAPGCSTGLSLTSPSIADVWFTQCKPHNLGPGLCDSSRDHAVGADVLVRGWPAFCDSMSVQAPPVRPRQYWLLTPPAYYIGKLCGETGV